jgi:uracil-DNA glycosylase family 4
VRPAIPSRKADPGGGAAPAAAGARTLDAIRADIVACALCPRLRTYCARVAAERKRAHRDDVYWGKPVPGFGDPGARLLIVGLAPAAHGGNRTGRVFTGDGSGDFLMHALFRTGFANIPTSRDIHDGLRLDDAYVLAAVRCAPPDNKPLPEEIVRCRRHMIAEIGALPRVRVVVTLGKIGFDAYLAYLGAVGRPVRPKPVFGHGSRADLGGGLPVLLGSYHPSRQNTNTGRLTPPMLESVFADARAIIQSRPPSSRSNER